MKLFFPFLISLLLSNSVFAQNQAEAVKMVEAGVALHDKGQFNEAIAKYKEALELDKDNINALCEIAYTYRAMKNFNESNTYAKRAIEVHLDDEFISHAFTTLGSNYDDMKDTTNALKAFRQGIHYFPKNSELNFNFGITLTGMNESYWPEAERAFLTCNEVNPNYSSAYNALGRLQFMQERRIPGLMVMGRFMLLEDINARREKGYDLIIRALTHGVNKSGKNGIGITINMPDTSEAHAAEPNNFDNAELLITLSAALNSSKKKNDYAVLQNGMSTLCSALEEGQAKGTGYYWETYAKFYIEMKQKDYLDTFCQILYISANDKKSKKWFKKNQSKVEEFYRWYFSFDWN